MSDTIVVCRPNQMREAAVVLSCLPDAPRTPLVVVERRPVSEAEYARSYEYYVDVRNQRDHLVGGALARAQLTAPQLSEFHDLDRKVEQAISALTPYRSWVKHNRFVSRLLEFIKPKRAVYLFPPAPEELSFIEPTPRFHLSNDRISMFPSIEENVVLADVSLAELVDAAWGRLRGSVLDGERIEIPEDDLYAYVTGLYEAIAHNRVLRPIRTTRPTANNRRFVDWPGSEPKEAVLIEVCDDAARLLGVLYAAREQARLIVCPPPSLSKVEHARAAVQEMVRRGGGKNVIGAVADFLNPDQLQASVHRLEAAVSEVVSAQTVAAVGDRALTAITDGVPYPFVKKKKADWSSKPIGHVTGDVSLIMLQELFGTMRSEGATFNLLFDPGFFEGETTETADVLGELRGQVSYSIVVKDEAASSVALTHLASRLPLDLVFFNTHGSEETIKLRDMPLTADKVVQRVALPTSPIVFNNSCLSWVGVGREFLRSGARAYIGTLWSVDAKDAAKYAKVVIHRSLADVNGPARSMHGAGIQMINERAYVFIGPCTSRYYATTSEPQEARSQMLSCGTRLFDALHSWLAESPVSAVREDALAMLLYVESKRAADAFDKRFPQPSDDRLGLLLSELQVAVIMSERHMEQPQQAFSLVTRGAALIEAMTADAKVKSARTSSLYQFGSRIPALTGQLDVAAGMLEASVAQAEEAGISPAPQLMELSDLYKTYGEHQAAVEAARRALELFDQAHARPEQRMLAIGRIAQAALRNKDYTTALNYAREGIEASVGCDDPRERAVFKGDEVHAYLGLADFPAALSAAREQLALAHETHDDLLELSAYGNLTRALMATGDYKTASEMANTGLEQARGLQNLTEVGDFLVDIGAIATAEHRHEAALGALCEAAAVYARAGRPEKVRGSLSQAWGAARAIDTWAAAQRFLEAQMSVMDGLPAPRRTELCSDSTRLVREAVPRYGLHQSIDVLRNLRDAAQAGDPCEQRKFIGEVCAMLLDYAAGQEKKAHEEAIHLDSISESGFKLDEFLSSLSTASGTPSR